MSQNHAEFQGQYRARMRHFSESNPNRHGASLQAGPIAGSKIPLVMMVLRVLVFNYPSAIDLGLGAVVTDNTGSPGWTSSSLVPFLVSGFLDYALIIAVSSTFSTIIGWAIGPLFPHIDLSNLLHSYAQPTCYFITLWYRLRIAGRAPLVRALRASYRQVLGSVKIFLVVLRVWPAVMWYIAIDRILGPNARKRMGLLVLQMAISLYTGFWDDSAVQMTKIFEDGGKKTENSPPNNGTLGWSGIFSKSIKNTVTYVPIELFIGSIPALLLLAHSGGLPRAIPWLGTLPIERWAAAVEERWVELWNKFPGHHPVEDSEVERLNELHASQTAKDDVTTEGQRPPRFIRLLRVEAGLYEDTVHCSLEWYDLDNAPKFKAISYAWGSSRLERTIILNGRKQAVTKSAFSALMAVRSEWRSRLFWIDALCIDQTDAVDKAHQIPFMSDIFHTAQKVIVWLGPAPGTDGSLALSAIHKLWTTITLHIEFGGPFETTDIPGPVWTLIKQLLLSPWFQRTWVVQEVVLARGSGSHTIIRYGDGSLDWQTLSWFIRNIRNYPAILNKLLDQTEVSPSLLNRPTPEPVQLTNPSHDPIMSTIRNLEAIHDFTTTSIPGTSGISLAYYLTRMFRTACTFQTKEDKDRVYALLGLPDNRTMSPAVSAVDYSGQSTEELFIKVAIHTLQDERIRPPCRLDFLAQAGLTFSQSTTQKLPSWVPNWNITSSNSMLPHPMLGMDGLRELVQGHMDYSFCRSIADMKSYGDINWGWEPWGPFHREYMTLLGSRLIATRKAFYKAGIPASCINKDNATLEMDPKFEIIPASLPGQLPKLKIRGVLAGKIAHLAKSIFPAPGTEKEIIYLPKPDGEAGQLEEYLNPKAFLPPDWRPLALRQALNYPPTDILFAFTRTIIGDIYPPEVDMKHAKGVPVRPVIGVTLLNVLGYEKLSRGYFGYEENLYNIAELERNAATGYAQPRLLKEVIDSHPLDPAQLNQAQAQAAESGSGLSVEQRKVELAWATFGETMDIHQQVVRMCAGRIFGVTGGGKMGLFPAGTRVDDFVVVFWGSMVPFVLRKVDSPGDEETYQLVGACYVHGIMDGEALVGVELGEGSDFVLV